MAEQRAEQGEEKGAEAGLDGHGKVSTFLRHILQVELCCKKKRKKEV